MVNKIFATAAVGTLSGVFALSAFAGEKGLSEEAEEKLAGYERTGEMQSCMMIRRIRDIDVLDEYHLLIEVGRNNYYLSELSNRCVGATRNSHRIQYSTTGGSLCASELITIVDNYSGFPQGSCSIGEFEKLEKVEMTDAP